MYITKFHGIVDRHVQQLWRRKHLMTSKIFPRKPELLENKIDEKLKIHIRSILTSTLGRYCIQM